MHQTRHITSPRPQKLALCYTANIEFTALFMVPLGALGQDEIHHAQVWRPRTSVATMLAAHIQAAAA